jgi:hypothetical protein
MKLAHHVVKLKKKEERGGKEREERKREREKERKREIERC